MGRLPMILVLLIAAISTKAGVPNWEVNPSGFAHSMVMVGTISIGGAESIDVDDQVAAFVGNEVRGVATLQYESSIDRYVAYLLVYGHSSDEALTFKIYDASGDAEMNVPSGRPFEINGLVGDLQVPYKWSEQALNTSAEMLTFELPGFLAEVRSGNEITIKMPEGSEVSGLPAEFEVAEGAYVLVDGIFQESGETINDFSNVVTYEVISEDRLQSENYQIAIEFVEKATILGGVDQTDILVYPNPTTDWIKVKGIIPMELVVLDALGRAVASSDSNEILIRNLDLGMYFLEIRSREGMIRKKFFKN